MHLHLFFSKVLLTILLLDMCDMKPDYAIPMIMYVWKNNDKGLSSKEYIE